MTRTREHSSELFLEKIKILNPLTIPFEGLNNMGFMKKSGIAADIRAFERHDKLIVLGLMAIFVGIIATIIQPIETVRLVTIRSGLMDLALLLLIADVIIHVGEIEKKHHQHLDTHHGENKAAKRPARKRK